MIQNVLRYEPSKTQFSGLAFHGKEKKNRVHVLARKVQTSIIYYQLDFLSHCLTEGQLTWNLHFVSLVFLPLCLLLY